jgi:hypothetical protein
MNLLEARVRFVDITGRYDLVKNTTDYEDAGANWFIREACKFLDGMTKVSHTVGSKEILLAPNEYLIDLSSVKSIESVQNEDKTVLRKLEREHFLRLYSVSEITTKVSDEPYECYTVASMPRTINIVAYKPTTFCWLTHKTLSQRKLFVNGSFRSDILRNDGDQNFWTVEMLGTLIKAAAYQCESFYRNREGMRDYLEGIQLDLQNLEFDKYENDNAGIIGMGDSY